MNNLAWAVSIRETCISIPKHVVHLDIYKLLRYLIKVSPIRCNNLLPLFSMQLLYLPVHMKQVIMTGYNCNWIFLNVFSLNSNDGGQSEILLRPLCPLMTHKFLSHTRPTVSASNVGRIYKALFRCLKSLRNSSIENVSSKFLR